MSHNVLTKYLCLTFSTLFLLLSVPNVEMKAEKCSCGRTNYGRARALVISGNKIDDLQKYPFIVSIHLKNGKYPWGYCAGALISDSFVITAAHCLLNKNFNCTKHTTKCFLRPSDMEVGLLGENQKRPSKKIKVQAIIPHPDYKATAFSDDIGLIKLEKPAKCSSYTQPICITKKDFVKPEEKVTIAGWGRTTPHDPDGSDVLLDGLVKKVNNTLCGSDSKIFCVVGTAQTPCKGDSGSAVFTKHNRRYFALGVTSGQDSSHPLCGLTSPIFFTKISSYYSFVSKHVKNLESI